MPIGPYHLVWMVVRLLCPALDRDFGIFETFFAEGDSGGKKNSTRIGQGAASAILAVLLSSSAKNMVQSTKTKDLQNMFLVDYWMGCQRAELGRARASVGCRDSADVVVINVRQMVVVQGTSWDECVVGCEFHIQEGRGSRSHIGPDPKDFVVLMQTRGMSQTSWRQLSFCSIFTKIFQII